MAAEARFAEGVRLMKAGDCAAALPEFRASQALDPASGTLLDIGYCEAQLGLVASAWFSYRQALALAEAKQRTAHENIARGELAKLEPELPYWSLEVKEEDPALRVELDGAPVERAVWSVGAPLDPGHHVLTLSKDGAKRWEKSFSVAPRERVQLEVPASVFEGTLPQPSLTPTPIAAQQPSATSTSKVSPVTPSASDGAGHSRNNALAFSAGGLGVAGLIGAGILFAGARHDYDAVDADCPNNRCLTVSSYDERNSAIRRYHWALGIGGASVALLGLAGALYFSGHSAQHTSNRPTLSVALDKRQFGVTWHEAF